MQPALASFASITVAGCLVCASCNRASEPDVADVPALEALEGPLQIGPRVDEPHAWGSDRPTDSLAFFRGSIELEDAWSPGQQLPSSTVIPGLVTRRDGASVWALHAECMPLEKGGILVATSLVFEEALICFLVLDLGAEGWRPRSVGLLSGGVRGVRPTEWIDELRGSVTLDVDACLPRPDGRETVALAIELECPGRTPDRFEQTILVDPFQDSEFLRDFLSEFPRAPRPTRMLAPGEQVGDAPNR